MNRWMDGSFLELNGETMEIQVDEFYREVFKLLKFFQQKQVKAAQEKEKISGMKKQKVTEEDVKRPDDPAVILCSGAMTQIKTFKVFKNC